GAADGLPRGGRPARAGGAARPATPVCESGPPRYAGGGPGTGGEALDGGGCGASIRPCPGTAAPGELASAGRRRPRPGPHPSPHRDRWLVDGDPGSRAGRPLRGLQPWGTLAAASAADPVRRLRLLAAGVAPGEGAGRAAV